MVSDSLHTFSSTAPRGSKGAEMLLDRLTTLIEITQQLTSTLELEPLLQHIVENAVRILDCEAGSLFLVDEQTRELIFTVAVGSFAAGLLGQRLPPGSGIVGQAVQMRQPQIENDLQHSKHDYSSLDQQRKFTARSLIVVPLQVKERVIGVVELLNRRDGLPFVEDDESLLTALASQAAAAIENARLYQEQEKRSRIIEALADIANEIATAREVLPALEQITRRAVDLLGTDNAAIYLLDDDGVTLNTVAAYGTYRNELMAHRRKIGEGITGSVFLNARAEIINVTSQDPRRIPVPGTPDDQEQRESLMSAPLILRGKTIGVINAWRLIRNGLFNEAELNFLIGIANQVSICIESGRLFEETRRQAQEAAAIAEVGREISATLELNVVLEKIASYAMDLLNTATSAVFVTDPSASTLRAVAALGKVSEELKKLSIFGGGIFGPYRTAECRRDCE
jgi:GAF domain-containing protein